MLYSFECVSCNTQFDEIKAIEERHNPTPCPKCGGASFKVITAPSGVMEVMLKDERGSPIWFPKNQNSYYDKQLGRSFNSPKEKQDHMKNKGIVMDGSLTLKKPKEFKLEVKPKKEKRNGKSIK